ncbi:MAG: SCO family protein [Acidobacteriia bacterium]|nr:SCO family protein [Terriglobia bacterium]
MTRRIKSGFAGFAFITFVSLLLASCHNSRTTYVLKGRVISKQPATQQLIIDSDDIPGFMPAMTMPYAVKDPYGFERVQPADIIRADLIVGPAGKFWLEHLVVTGKGAARSNAESVAPPVLGIGDMAPDVPLVNQDGKTIRFGQFKGKAVLLTFIYTRCPFPDYCPLLTRQFAIIQKELAKNPDDYKRTHLISISLDPNYDKPPVMREYGLSNMEHDPKGFQHWDFVSTTPADLQKLVASFGLDYSEQDGQISHDMLTILLAPNGAIAHIWPYNNWKTSEVLDVMRHISTLSN